MKAKIECPYPGLRPFQEHESAIFFGRESQIAEIVNRLKNSRFVAVLGGSGSGKSSLVLAGAIPELRAEAIEGDGDFWVPVVASPGTNPKNSSPITRMAERFCSLLAPISDEKLRQDRIADCTRLLRTANGLNLLINKYGRDLGEKHRDGVDLQLANSNEAVDNPNAQGSYLVKVNFLFLIDQFEELFHPSNDLVKDDCRHLVERIVDHFQQCKQGDDVYQSTRLCVVITMRSEHLNDCTRYADLPDAINAAVYLVKRLNRQEIIEAIVKPVDAFLRQQFRQAVMDARKEGVEAPDKKNWPKAIDFSSDVIERLMLDTDSIVSQQDHADLLPLLQHLLYWIWVCAVVRTQANKLDNLLNANLPDAIKLEDLDAALSPNDLHMIEKRGDLSSKNQDRSFWFKILRQVPVVKPASNKLEEDRNALTACLEKRCEWIYLRRENDSTRSCWEKIFPNLAFKDPNTGTYTQRRVDIRDLCHRQGLTVSTETDTEQQIKQLKQHLQPWLGDELGYHQYLYWDADSLTLKVTHESLIRRWKRFREWIDWKDRQFMEYIQALENCSHWQQDGKKWGDLISDSVILGRIKEYGLRDALKNEGLKSQFTDLLKLHRDKTRLVDGCDDLEAFINGSFNKRYWKFSVYGSLFLLFFSFYVALNSSIEARFKEKKTNLLSAISITAETRLPPSNVIEKFEQEQIALRNLLAAVGLKNRSLPSSWFGWIYKVADYDWYEDEREKEYRNWLWSESKTLGGLRSALLGRAWRPKSDNHSKPNDPTNAVPCKRVEIAGTTEYVGSTGYFFEKTSGYGLLGVTVIGQKFGFGTQVFWGKKDPDDVCLSHVGQQVWWAGKDSILGFVTGQNYLVEFQDKTATIVAIDWPIDSFPEDQQPLATPQKYILDNKVTNHISGIQQNKPLISLHTRMGEEDAFFEDIQIGQSWYRFFNRWPTLKLVATEPNGERAKLVSHQLHPGDQQNTLAINAPPENDDSKICSQWLKKAQTVGNAQTWQIKHNNNVLCLVVNDAEAAKGMYYADLYQVRKYDEDHLPLISGMFFGSDLPDAIKVDFEKGWLYFSLNGKWYQQPWSSDAWVKLAAGIDLPLPFSESMKSIESESRYTKFKWHLKDKDFNLDDLASEAICSATSEQHFCSKDKAVHEVNQ